MEKDVAPRAYPVVASLRGVEVNGKKPEVMEAYFVAPDSAIFGAVKLEKGSSVWYGTILRGDKHQITIGRRSLVLDNVRIRADLGPVKIGSKVFIASSTNIV